MALYRELPRPQVVLQRVVSSFRTLRVYRMHAKYPHRLIRQMKLGERKTGKSILKADDRYMKSWVTEFMEVHRCHEGALHPATGVAHRHDTTPLVVVIEWTK